MSGGDAGVFGMASAVFEAAADHPDVPIEVLPGVSAVQAVAAKAGAPIGADFAVVSLSDRLKPWPVIEKRLHAIAEADLVLAVYNPASRSRTTQVADLQKLFLEHRSPDTVVVVGRDVGRAEESLTVTTLAELEADTIDMKCLLIVGASSTTVTAAGQVWTPALRGVGVTVHFVGAGPGAADLITLRAASLLAAADVVLYPGTYLDAEVLSHCAGARQVDTQKLDLDQITAVMVTAAAEGQEVVRLTSGDPSLYSALAEQTARLDAAGVPWDVCPGVPAYAAAAAAVGRELTVPLVAQSVVLTRTQARSTAMPATESLAAFAATRATLVLHLAITKTRVAGRSPWWTSTAPTAPPSWSTAPPSPTSSCCEARSPTSPTRSRRPASSRPPSSSSAGPSPAKARSPGSTSPTAPVPDR